MTSPDLATNLYLSGNFAPVRDEVDAVALPVTGAIPVELDGRLLRTGPNPVTDQDPATYQWFTGTGMAHGLWLRGGQAIRYRNRFVRSDDVVEALGGPATPGPRHGDGSVVNTNIIGHADRTFVLVEGGNLPMELTNDLITVARSDFGGTLPGAFSAHPKRDPGTGELHAVSYYWEWDYIEYSVIGVDGTVRRTVDVPVPGGPMVHDMGLTESRVVLLDLPCVFDLEMAMGGSTLPYRWTPEYGARVGLLPREADADATVWCELDDPCFVFHPLNAYDDGETVVMDVVVYSKVFDQNPLAPDEDPSPLERWVVNPRSGRVDRTLIDPRCQEFPRVDERRVGRPHRYGYCLLARPDGDFGDLVKHDLTAGTSVVHELGDGRHSQEGVFVPKHADAAEDEGWVLAYVHDERRNAADVVIIDAQDFAAPPVATIHLPVRVPYGFHGNWVAS